MCLYKGADGRVEGCARCIYTGTVEVVPEQAQDLLRAADQYLLEGLKRQCEYAIAKVHEGE